MSDTIGLTLQKAKQNLKAANISSYALDAEVILANILKCKRTDLILRHDNLIKDSDAVILKKHLELRIQHKPVSQIVEKREFYGRDFIVNEHVLDPRADTETLIDAVLKNYSKQDEIDILDLGCGSGAIILTLLSEFAQARGVTIDISKDALVVAKENAKNLNIFNRCHFLEGSWNDNIDDVFDLIVSNPPYIPYEDLKSLASEVKDFEPHLALFADDSGLYNYKYLAKNLAKNCHDNTKLFFEIGMGQEKDIIAIFEKNGFVYKENYKDLAGIIRVLEFGR